MKPMTYFEQVEAAALAAGVTTLALFKAAGVSTSTFYRAREGADLHINTRDQLLEMADVLRHDNERTET